MLRQFIEMEVTMQARQRLSLAHIAGGVVVCLSGSLWVTQQDGEDYLLHRGETLLLGEGAVIVEALAAARLQLRQPERHGLAHWLARIRQWAQPYQLGNLTHNENSQ